MTLIPVSGWSDPLKPQALITDTSVPTEFYQLQNTAHSLLSKSNAKALNSLVTSLANITKDKQTQVAQIISGLGALTTTVDQRSGQVSQLIDSANTLSSTLASRDQQLLSIVNNLDTVSTGLASNDQDLGNLITNVDSMASQTNSLVSQDSPALNSLLQSLHADLTVVGQHQEDSGRGRELPRWSTQGLPVHRLQRVLAGPVGQHLRQPDIAHQHLRRHRAVRGPGPGPGPDARARPHALCRPNRPAARRGVEHQPRDLLLAVEFLLPDDHADDVVIDRIIGELAIRRWRASPVRIRVSVRSRS